MKKISFVLVIAITIIANSVNAQIACNPCQNIAGGSTLYNFDLLSTTSSFMVAVKKRINCSGTPLCLKGSNNIIDYIYINPHNISAICNYPDGSYNAYTPFTVAYDACLALGANNTAVTVANFTNKLRGAAQDQLNQQYGVGVRQLVCVEIYNTMYTWCCGNIPGCNQPINKITLKVKHCGGVNSGTLPTN